MSVHVLHTWKDQLQFTTRKVSSSSVKITTDRVQQQRVQRCGCITSRQNGDSMLGWSRRRQNVQERLLGGAHV